MRLWKIMMVLCFVIALVSLPLMTACGGDDETPTASPTKTGEPTTEPPEEVTITIGNLTDKTGAASQAMQVVDMALEDLVRYYNENNFIPNVKMEIIEYDTQYEPARDIPGYEWIMDRGADFIYAGLPTTPIAIKANANRDEVVTFCSSGLEEVGNPPGWLFTINPAFRDVAYGYLGWIAENHWDYEANGPAKLGFMTWATPAFEEFLVGFERYVEEHPEQFVWEGRFLERAGTFTWDEPANGLRDADYVFLPGAGMIPAIKALRDAGSEATLMMTDTHIAFLGMVRDASLVEKFDGTLCELPCRWWNEDAELVNLAKELLVEYRGQSELDSQMARGGAYMTSMHMFHGMLEAVKQTVEDVGAENFSSQALYDTLTDFTVDPGEAYEPWAFTETSRYGYDYFRMYEWDSAENDLVSADPEWYPFPKVE
ncbi:MAG: ABC transporter substrate-binding protein [Dehalococcoidia bacterium]